MRDFQDKNKNGVMKRLFYSVYGIVFLGILVLVFGWGVMNFMFKMEVTARNKDIAEQKMAELQRRKENLEREIDELNTDKGKEKVFREDFGMGRDGEGLIVVIDEKKVAEKEVSRSKEFLASVKEFFSRLIDN